MRKFVIKNRHKRKYTKKSEVVSSYSSAKTAYGMIPLIIMLIAFMSTIVISTPFRDSIANIRLTFEFPQFSLHNPLSFFETGWADITQVGLVFWTIVQMIGITLSQTLFGIAQKVTYGALFVSNFFILFGSGISIGLLYIIKELVYGIQLINQTITVIVNACTLAIHFCIQILTNTTISIGQFIASVTLSAINASIQFSLVLIHDIVIAMIAVIHFLAVVITIIWKMLVSTAFAVNTFFIQVFTAIGRVIEIPFKTLYSFWLLIKPYADIFGNHLKMSGNDFSNMFTSLGKVSSITRVSK
jgi:hypothetical protein